MGTEELPVDNNMPDNNIEPTYPTFDFENTMEEGIERDMMHYIDEEPVSEPEPEFDPEASIATPRYGRRKLLILGGVFLGVVAAVAIVTGVSYSKSRNQVPVKSSNIN